MYEFGVSFNGVVVPDVPQHPFFPRNAQVPGYIATSRSTAVLLTVFTGVLAAILALTMALLQWFNPRISSREMWTTSWFILCGFIHFFFEGYFSYNALDMGSRTDLLGQLWKEYALSDSRYMTQDAFIVCMESVTAYIWGPLSFLCAYYIATDHPVQQPLQLIISLGQLYGLILYYATHAFQELVHGIGLSRPERIYYYVYYVICNAFWLLIPGWLICQSIREISTAFAKTELADESGRMSRTRAASGT